MKKWPFVALLLVGATILGATVLREPIGNAASPFTNVIVGNDATNPVPVTQQGTVTIQAAMPSKPFSILGDGVSTNVDGCGANLPAGTKWFISSFGAANSGAFDGGATLFIRNSTGDTFTLALNVATKMNTTSQLTFPQPFIITSPADGSCLVVATDDSAFSYVVGYRQ
jgi:hypothetical protein